jgi:NAD-dependent dihydropyrimidine dehydrogenase PreA subunit
MSKRKIIRIDEAKCTGCGLCIPNCPEGAIQIIDGKARLVSDLLCDGLGACLGHCPEGAIAIEEREAEAYDEAKVMESIVKQGPNTVKAHLEHLRDHRQMAYLQQAVAFLAAKGIPNPMHAKPGGGAAAALAHGHGHGGCPGAQSMSFASPSPAAASTGGGDESGKRPSQLTHWPVQLHLIGPHAPQYQNADLLLAADCVAYALADFHKDYLKGKALAIACPKLDEGQDVYVDKLRALIDEAKVNTLTVMIMQVPCCSGLLRLAREAVQSATRKVPIKCVVVGLQGAILREEWVSA